MTAHSYSFVQVCDARDDAIYATAGYKKRYRAVALLPSGKIKQDARYLQRINILEASKQ